MFPMPASPIGCNHLLSFGHWSKPPMQVAGTPINTAMLPLISKFSWWWWTNDNTCEATWSNLFEGYGNEEVALVQLIQKRLVGLMHCLPIAKLEKQSQVGPNWKMKNSHGPSWWHFAHHRPGNLWHQEVQSGEWHVDHPRSCTGHTSVNWAMIMIMVW